MSLTTRLVHAAHAGDRRALQDLFAQHQGRLHAFIRARLSLTLARRVPPEDLLQETLLEATRKVAEFEAQGPGSFYRWLVGIARFKISEAHRAQQARKRSLVDEVEDEADLAGSLTSPSGRAMRNEGADRVLGALRELGERQAEAVRLRYLEGLSVAETAERLACSEAAVKALVGRGLDELARRLGPLPGQLPGQPPGLGPGSGL
ncbi:MAG: RNA polymerase sigma factor [Planctomycetota bacterium]